MTLHWSSVCIKYLLFTFNLLFVITGIVIMSVGVTIKAFYRNYESFLDDQYFSTPNLLIAIGVIIFLIAFFGCCGAVKENYCMTLTFSCLLILIFILEFSAGISGYVLRNQTREFLTNRLTQSLAHYNASHYYEITALWDEMQRTFECCGVYGPSDWNSTESSTNGGLPVTCCSSSVGVVGTFTCTSNSTNVFTTGCVDAFGSFVKHYAVTIGSVCMAIAFIQLMGIIFSCYLSRQIKLNYETV